MIDKLDKQTFKGIITQENDKNVIRRFTELENVLSNFNDLKKLKQYCQDYCFSNKIDYSLTLFSEAEKELMELKKYCKLYGVKINFQPSLARGLSYYNGTVFEIKTKKIKETICAGGSYMINGVQSTGISLGLDRLKKLAKIELDNKSILIISINQDKDSIKLARDLRENKIKTTLWTKPGISKALDFANSYEIPFVIFVGKEEIKIQKFKLRDMNSGKEQNFSKPQLIKKLTA